MDPTFKYTWMEYAWSQYISLLACDNEFPRVSQKKGKRLKCVKYLY